MYVILLSLLLKMSSVLTLLFAPTFLILINFFQFKTVVLVYILLSVIVLVYAFAKRKKTEDFVIVAIYFVLLCLAYMSDSFEAVKLIPVFSALTFATIFAYSALKKQEIIYKFTTKFYKKKLDKFEVIYLKQGDSFWAVAIFLYALFLVSLVFFSDDTLWAFFSSVGWYIYFVIVLTLQIIYGKFYAIKMLSK